MASATARMIPENESRKGSAVEIRNESMLPLRYSIAPLRPLMRALAKSAAAEPLSSACAIWFQPSTPEDSRIVAARTASAPKIVASAACRSSSVI